MNRIGIPLCLVAVVGCSSTYLPKTGPRIAVSMEAGQPVFIRDGQRFTGGMFGGDIDKAVEGNPAAEEHARTFKNGMRGGFACVMGAVVLLGAGMYTSFQGVGNSRDARVGTSLGLLGSAIVLDIVGLVWMLSAQPHLWDAINIYNDGKAYIPVGARPSLPTGLPVFTF